MDDPLQHRNVYRFYNLKYWRLFIVLLTALPSLTVEVDLTLIEGYQKSYWLKLVSFRLDYNEHAREKHNLFIEIVKVYLSTKAVVSDQKAGYYLFVISESRVVVITEFHCIINLEFAYHKLWTKRTHTHQIGKVKNPWFTLLEVELRWNPFCS